MKKLLYLFLLLILPLHSQEKIRLAAESEPLLTVADCVNVMNGSFFQVDQDLVIDGPLPLCYTRYYDSGNDNSDFFLDNHYGYGIGLGYPLRLQFIQYLGKILVDQRHRYGISFQIYGPRNLRKGKIDPDMYKQGYTNCTEALERGQPSLAHTEILIHKSSYPQKHIWDVTDTDGTKRVYAAPNIAYDIPCRYLLQRTIHPNGLTTHYEYYNARLKSVSLKNTFDDELLTSINYDYNDKENKYTVTSSDGRIFYHDMAEARGWFNRNADNQVKTSVLKAVSSTDLPVKVYWYATPNHSQEVLPIIARVDNPDGRYLIADYANQRTVTSLWAPLAADGGSRCLYFFDYQKDKTVVTNALGVKYTYCFPKKRLEELWEADLRIRKYDWNDQGELKSKTLCDTKNNILEGVYFQCDTQGRIAHKWDYGNITGDGPDSYSITPHRYLENARSTNYKYGPFSNLIQEQSPNGTVTIYGYKSGTNLVTSKLILYKNSFQERDLYSYDKNAILIEKIEDNGTTSTPEDLSGVTYRLITRIQPQMDKTKWGLTKPAVKEKYYLDLNTGEEKLLKRKEYEYTRGGLLTSKKVYDATGALAYQETYSYTENLLLEEKCDRAGRVTRYGYDANHNVIFQELVSSGMKLYKSYDKCNRLVEKKELHDDGLTLITGYGYDLMGNLTSKTDHHGFTTQYFYDSLNRRIKEIDPYGHEITTVYDLRDNPIATTDKEGNTTRTRYNIDHNPLRIDYPDGTAEEFRYTIDGALKTKTEKDGSSVGYTYDYRGRILTESRYDQQGTLLTTQSFLYKGDTLISETDPQGFVTHYSYDGAGRVISKSKEGITESYSYDALGRRCTTTKGGRVTRHVFDLLDRPIEETIEDLAGKVYRKKSFSYDIHGNVCKEHVDTGDKIIETLSVYNSCNLPVLEIDGMGNETRFSYNYRPFQKVTVDPLGKTTIETYDAFSRVISTEIPSLAKQEAVYSPNGHRIKQIDHIFKQKEEQGLFTISWEYDSMGNLTTLIEQDLKETRNTYRDGRLDTIRKPDGVILTHSYDALGRLIEQSSSDGTLCTQYTYDLNGNMLSAADKIKNNSVQRTYDAFNNIVSETTDSTLYYSYDELDRLIEIRLPDESTVNYSYNPTDLVSIDRGGKTHSYLYDLAGRIVQENTFDGTLTFYSYNDNHLVTSISAPYHLQTFLYNAVNNIVSASLNGQTTVYSYDGLYQLTSEDNISYSYDSLFNRLTKNDDQYQHNALNQVLSDNQHAYTYDPNGNRLTKDGTTYTYDALNRLTSAGDISYTYDALGRLHSRSSFDSQESYLYYKDYDLGTLDNLKIIGKGIAALEHEGNLYTVIRDHRGSPCVLIKDGLSAATYTYTAFGETTHTGTLHCPWQFSGYRCDVDTQLLHAQKRVYDSSLGRWLTPDPLGFTEGPNLYAYVHNNPLIFIDPTGLWGEWISSICESISDAFSSAYDSVCSVGRCFTRGAVDDATWGATEYAFGECQRQGAWEHGAYYAGMGASMAIGLCSGNTWAKVGYKTGRYALKEGGKYFAKESGKALSRQTCREALSRVTREATHLGVDKIKRVAKDRFFPDPLKGTKYTERVEKAIYEHFGKGEREFHSFPKHVDNYARHGNKKNFTGGDGIPRTQIDLPGSYMNRDGNFEWIINPDYSINHRFFREI